MSVSSSTGLPAPFSVSPSWSWDGDDGSWSTFQISVGTPEQSFRILPSTTGAETWVPIPVGCEGILANVADCGTMRGVDNFNGKKSKGFQTDASSTWDLIGIYELTTEQNLWGPTGNPGDYGLDTVSLQNSSGKSVNLKGQTIAGVATGNVWLGSLGMGTAPAKFDVEKKNIPSLLDSMKSQNYTPSLSFGYTAGASYSDFQTPGSLVIGGYDKARVESFDLPFPVDNDSNGTLAVDVKSIIADNVFGGTLSMLPNGKSMTTSIDSTTSQLWLPKSVCDLFASAFGLKYDSYTELYLVNDTTHRQLKQTNPSVTFTLGNSDSSSSTTNIVLPYAAFDLQAGIPLYNYSTNYFPIRVAANESQQVLGRAFLQEAYIFVNWEAKHFQIGQAVHQNHTTNIVPIYPIDSTSGNGNTDSGLSTGAIVGIAVGACALIALAIGLAAFFVVRSRRRQRVAAHMGKDVEPPSELSEETVVPPEIMSHQVYELQEGENSKHELFAGAKPVSELPAESLERELQGDGEVLGTYGRDKKRDTYYELP